MHKQESVARRLEDSPPRIKSHERGGKVLGTIKPDAADIIFFPEVSSSEAFLEKVKKSQGLKMLVRSAVIGLTAAAAATALNGTTTKRNNDNTTVIEFQEPSIEIVTPKSAPDESKIMIEVDDDFEFAPSIPSTSPTPEQTSPAPEQTPPTPEQTTEPTEQIADDAADEAMPQAYEDALSPQISSGLDIAIRTAFSEGAYNSEEDARKIADVIINRAIKNGTSVGTEVSNGEFEAYNSGVKGNGNWGWEEYGSGPGNGSIGTERVQQIFMEELNKAALGQPLAYDYTRFGASGDGKTNTFH